MAARTPDPGDRECIIPVMEFVLASASPRRADLLRAAGYAFEVHPADVDERPRMGETPAAYVSRVARAKADAVARGRRAAFVLGADTCVVVAGQVLGKPRDDSDALAMLNRLSGRTHEVLTGVTICHGREASEGLARTIVRFVRLESAEMRWYVDTGEPRGKAGAYAIQGVASRFVDHIEGSYSNVVGLPVALVAKLLAERGFQPAPPESIERR